MASLTIDKQPTFKIKCIASNESYIAFISNTTKNGNQLALYQSSRNLGPIKCVDLGEDNPVEVKFMMLEGSLILVVVCESMLRIFNMEGVLLGTHREQNVVEESEDWFSAVQIFENSIILATRTGRLITTQPGTINFKNKVQCKKPVSSMCSVGKWLVIGDETGKISRLNSLWEGTNKQLNLNPQKLPIYLILRFSPVNAIVGTCSGQLLLVDVSSFTVEIRIQAHACMLTSITCLKDTIATASEDGSANLIKIVDRSVAASSTYRFGRIITGTFFIEGKAYVSCYELPMLFEIPS